MKYRSTYSISKFVFMSYDCNLFDVIIAHFVIILTEALKPQKLYSALI